MEQPDREFCFNITNQNVCAIEVDTENYAFVFDTPTEFQKVIAYQSWSKEFEFKNRFVTTLTQEEWINDIHKYNQENDIDFKPTVVMNNKFIFAINKFKYYNHQMIWIVSTKEIFSIDGKPLDKKIAGDYVDAFFSVDNLCFMCKITPSEDVSPLSN